MDTYWHIYKGNSLEFCRVVNYWQVAVGLGSDENEKS